MVPPAASEGETMARTHEHNHRGPSTGQVHRFGNSVATHLPGMAQTIYMSAKEARKLARALNAAARSVDHEPFTASDCTAQIPFARTDIHREL